ncbi:aromatic amino acid DMT transporter YddG, partial [Vibrio crassostreae]|uniref:aromatic amino acid DMT transporter YddG n=1 Tax=Vibrio crassostreae TaxID=246167 RepID=UPI0003763CAD
IEMAVINYLWPALTVLFAVLLSDKKINWLVYPSIFLAFFGVAWSISGDQGLSVEQIAANVATNPKTYSMAFFGAIIWAVYCNYTQKVAKGQNAIVLFFIATAITLWIKYALSNETGMVMTTSAAIDLVLAGVCMGAGYALWNTAILGGNMVFLATMSYFTPIFATLLSSIILGLSLSMTFWQGVCMVTIGSLACWWVTRDKKPTVTASASKKVQSES